MREACRPAASGTPTGAAESPLPLPTGLHVVRAVTARHRHRLGAGSTRRTWLVAELLGDGAGEGLGRLSLTSTTVDPVDVARASSEAYTVARSGCATAAAVMASAPRTHNATCTAQSVRPGMPYSRVPSSRSMIHTRSAETRAEESLASSESTASPGRFLSISVSSSSLERASPNLPNPLPVRPEVAASCSSRPARSASLAAGRASVVVDGLSSPGGQGRWRRARSRRRRTGCLRHWSPVIACVPQSTSGRRWALPGDVDGTLPGAERRESHHGDSALAAGWFTRAGRR